MRIVVTGIGLLSSLGIGASSVFNRMVAGETSKNGEIPGFDATTFLGDRGLRHFDRTALVLASAARLAAQQSDLGKAAYGPEEIGVVVGSTHGSIQAITEFDQEAVREGPNYVNPQDFANTVISQPASRVSVIFNATGLNTTIATGGASALDALAYGMTMLRLGRVSTLLCGSALGTSSEIEGSYAKAGKMIISSNGVGPFAAGRKGPKLGEGGAVLILEDEERARRRNARVLGVVSGVGSFFGNGAAGMVRAMKEAVQQAELLPDQISCVISYASGSLHGDCEEGHAISDLFPGVPVTAPKSQTRDCLEASGAIHMAVSLLSIQTGKITPIPGLDNVDSAFSRMDLVRGNARSVPVKHVLVNARDDSGHNAAVVISAAS
jgi:3-oxoacyl-[acyl-carrier-protein] synthase II